MKKLLTGSVVATAFLIGLGFTNSAHALEKNLLTIEEAYAIAENRSGDETVLDRSRLRLVANRSVDRRRAAHKLGVRKSKLTHGFDRRDDSDLLRFKNRFMKAVQSRATAARRSGNGLPFNKFRNR